MPPEDDGSGDSSMRGRWESTSPALRSAVEWGAVILGALGIALLIQTFLFQAFLIPSGSMQPTLRIGDRVLVNKLSYRSGGPSRGDLIVFTRPPGSPESDINDLIKRVVGLPGETLEAVDGFLLVDGEPLGESYLPEGTRTDNLPPTTVPDGEVFVMGDNRGESLDSRIFGPIGIDTIEGRAFLRIWPLGDIGGL